MAAPCKNTMFRENLAVKKPEACRHRPVVQREALKTSPEGLWLFALSAFGADQGHGDAPELQLNQAVGELVLAPYFLNQWPGRFAHRNPAADNS